MHHDFTLNLQRPHPLVCACDLHLDVSHQDIRWASSPLAAILQIIPRLLHRLRCRNCKSNKCLIPLLRQPSTNAPLRSPNRCRHGRDCRQGAPNFQLHSSRLQRELGQWQAMDEDRFGRFVPISWDWLHKRTAKAAYCTQKALSERLL